MPLAEDEARWVYVFTAGAVPLPLKLAKEDEGNDVARLKNELKLALMREAADEQALKEVLLARANKAIDGIKEALRASEDFAVTRLDETGKEVTERTRDPKGQQQNGFEASTTEGVQKVADLDIKSGAAGQFLVEVGRSKERLTAEKDKLLAVTVQRSYIDEKAKKVLTRTAVLFSDKEIMDEIYTPLVREMVLAETFIDARFSATQKMIDGSNDYYIKECKEKGKEVASGGVGVAKAGILLAASITTTVLGALAPVSTGESLDHSGTISKFTAAEATDITNGIAATLNGTIDLVDQTSTAYKGGDFPVSGLRSTISTLGVGIGKLVAGFTGNQDLGLSIAEGIGGFADVGAIRASDARLDSAIWRSAARLAAFAALVAAFSAAVPTPARSFDALAAPAAAAAFLRSISIEYFRFAIASPSEVRLQWVVVFAVFVRRRLGLPEVLRHAVRPLAVADRPPELHEIPRRRVRVLARQALHRHPVNQESQSDPTGDASPCSRLPVATFMTARRIATPWDSGPSSSSPSYPNSSNCEI